HLPKWHCNIGCRLVQMEFIYINASLSSSVRRDNQRSLLTLSIGHTKPFFIPCFCEKQPLTAWKSPSGVASVTKNSLLSTGYCSISAASLGERMYSLPIQSTLGLIVEPIR